MRRLTCLLMLGSSLALAGNENTAGPLEAEARQVVQRFVGELKPQLQQAMAEGGPAHAVTVCAEAAPRIADSLAAQTGWDVTRVSLQQRNPSRAVPDAWEREVLEKFNRERAAGASAAQLSESAVVRGQFRYMQAQVTEALCLACHGDNLDPSTRAALQTYYPDDRATGYTLGEVRGAISLARGLGGD